MPLPNIQIAFEIAASETVRRAAKGTVALIIRDEAEQGFLELTAASDIPQGLSSTNAAFIERAFIGYINKPVKVLLYILPTDAEQLDAAFAALSGKQFDYLCGPPDITAEEKESIKAWVIAQRKNNAIYKAVLPGCSADNEGIINFTTAWIKVGSAELDTAEMCSRIAGLIAGTPMAISCTYAPLTEISQIRQLEDLQAYDKAVDDGKLVLLHDGRKAKIARGVNSLTTVTAQKGEIYKKIKIVELLDMIQTDIRMTAEDNYIGKCPNSYEDKLQLVTAVSEYFKVLENENLLKAGASEVGIDLEAQTAFIKAQGVDISELSEQEIKEYNTGDKVFLAASVVPLDAVEDITLNIGLKEVA